MALDRSAPDDGAPRWLTSPRAESARPRPALSLERVVRTALRMADAGGLPVLTMRALANELSVTPMALYTYVRGKEELLDLMADFVLGQVDRSGVAGDWVAQLRALAASYHQVLHAHAGLAQVFGDGVTLGPSGMLVMERALEILLGAGFPPRPALGAFHALYHYTLGFHVVRRDFPPGVSVGSQPDLADYPALARVAGVAPHEIPCILSASGHLDDATIEETFQFGLDLLLEGLRAGLRVLDAAEDP